MRNILLVLGVFFTLASCGFPAGAPIQAEVLAEADASDPEFSVVEVTRANLDRVGGWPTTGWRGHYRWLEAGGGASSTTIRPGDRVNLVIWDNQTNSLLTDPNSKSTQMNGIEVSPAGAIFVPYVGDVVINGLSPDAARIEVQKEVERIAPSAQVQLSVVPGENNTVDLVRGVARPGPVELPSRNFTILSLISRGGGIAERVRNPLVRLIRNGQTYEIRAEDLLSDARRNIVMRGGDKVIVEEDQRYFVAAGATGDQLVYFDREHVTAMEALSMAGGLFENRADPKGILILRDYPASALRADGIKGPQMEQVVFTVDLTSADGLFAARTFEVHPGDLVLVTESPMIGVTQTIGLVSSALLARTRL
ncbi:polysaccharide biosynthesis/export family protein [Sinisalibacter aestuarii]|uniref:Polysaccharide biosynthesis protein n=1 Tax=Sinisalibacter aestuarii TaxID=2949426 RepID=A0ABQ5LW36_9RHOB|nr:polysaccharide biosynthesis/export family protein [Sinisalibacter aestuarii]GKY88818.1 polysaccharide biosynthesis protein [Sinisalibacter aestuarii]